MKLYILIFLSFILPWIVGINIYLKDKKIIMIIAPFAAMLSFILNTPGIDYGFFYPSPVNNIKLHTLAILPSIGFFSILSCLFVFTIRYTKISPLYSSFIFAIIGCAADLVYIGAGFLKYNNGWNILFSFLGFLISFSIIYLYYLALKKFALI
jgi:hypothetical protein